MFAPALLLAALSALPATAPGCPTAQARASYIEGRRLLREGDAAGAVAELARARTECPAPAVEFQLALAYERLGRLSLAMDALDKFLAAPIAAANRVAVHAWVNELRARAEAERLGVPAPSSPPRPPPPPPPLYFADEESALTRRSIRPAAPALDGTVVPARWLFLAAGGLAIDGALQPGRLSGHDGAISRYGGSYQIGLAYRVSRRARLDIEALVCGAILPWTRSDLAGGRDAVFATVIAIGLRADVPLFTGSRARVFLAPSVAAGLGSISLNVDPTYQNAVALRFGLAMVVEHGAAGVFVEPQGYLFTGGDLAGRQWTVGADVGVRVRF